MKTPDGYLVEEYTTEAAHYFVDGELLDHVLDGEELTGRFRFDFADGRSTRWYTEKSAPKWLQSYFDIVTDSECGEGSEE